jgi:hypothetical protein
LYAITNTCQLNTKRKKEVICIQKLIHLGITILELLFSVFFKVLLLESWFIFFFEKPNWITVRAVAISVLSQWMFVLARDISEQRKRKEILDETQKQDSKKSWVENW